MKDTKIDVVEMLESLGIQGVKERFDEVEFECPFGNHRAGGSASMNTETTAWFCFGCKSSGNAVTFVSMFEGVPPWTARRWLKERYGGGFSEPRGGMTAQIGDLLSQTPKEPRSQLEPMGWPRDITPVNWTEPDTLAHEYMVVKRGFSPETLDNWMIGRDRVSNRIAIPVRRRDGALVGFKGRLIPGAHLVDRKDSKYIVLGGNRYTFPTYDIGKVLFGQDRCKGIDIVLCEGELNVIALHLAGIEAVAAAHSSLTPTQMTLLRDHASRVTIWFDDDEAGRNGVYGWTNARDRRVPGLVEMLSPFMSVKVVTSQSGDPAELTIQERVDAVQNAVSPLVQSVL